MNTPHYTWADSPIHDQIRKMNDTPTPETDAAYKNHAADMHPHIQLDFARKLERERDEARFDLDFRRRLGDLQNKTIDDLTKQRDEARESLEFQRKLNVEMNERAKCDLHNMTEQRDMLVEALEIAANRFRYPEFKCNWENVAKEIESALQSLPTKP